MKQKNIFLLILLISSLIVQAVDKIKVTSILGDNMVLQRNTDVKIWGISNPNEKISVETNWNKSIVNTVSNQKGEWLVKVKTTEAGGPYTINIASKKERLSLKNILLGEVWLCSGQSNMQMPVTGFGYQPVNGSTDILLDADNDNIRLFTVERAAIATPQDTCVGSWKAANAESVAKFSAVGYLYAKQLQRKLKVPIGMICSSWGGSRIEAWMDKETISNFPEPSKETTQEKTQPHQRASNLYNGMISPIINYSIKGAIWYQGESNRNNYKDYAGLMVGMVESWRNDFGVGNFPFYFVEIAPFPYGDNKSTLSALFCDAQLKAMSLIPNSGMVSTIDLGSETWIHPAEKETVSKRLALWALSETYGVKGLSYKSPIYKSMTVKDSIATLLFDNSQNGFTDFGKGVECFEVAGIDSVFYPAKLNLKNREVEVYSDKVKKPVAVRYGFCNFPKTTGYLYNTVGLPVPSFRTDDWKK